MAEVAADDVEEVIESPAEPVAEAPVEETPVVEEGPVEEAAEEPAEAEPVAEQAVEAPEETAETKKKSAKSMVGSLLDRMRKNKPNASVRPINPMSPVRPNARKPGAVRNLDQRGAKPADGEEKKKDVRKKTGLNVKLAAMPEVKQPKPGSSSTGEKVQKPDIALPQDAIAKARSGAAPLEQFTKSSKVKKKGKGTGGEDSSEGPSAKFVVRVVARK